MGAIRQSDKVLKMKGTYRSYHGKEEEKVHLPVMEDFRPPEWLSDEAVKEWHRITLEFRGQGVLKNSHIQPLGLYCELVAEMQEDVRKFPASKMIQLRGLCKVFGLTPAEEGGLRASGVEKDNKFSGV